MSSVVLDASVAVAVLAVTTSASRVLADRLRTTTVHAPHLIDAEVGHVLRRRVAIGQVPAEQAAGALRALPDLVHQRYPHTALSHAAWALRDNLTYHDALYVALASRLDIPLLTADMRLARAPGPPCAIEVIAQS